MESDCSTFAIIHRRLLHLLENSEGFIRLSRGEMGFSTGGFAESHDNVVEQLSSKDHLTYHEAKEHVLNLPSNHRSPTGASSKNSKPQHEANPVSSTNGKKDKKQKKGSSSSSNSGGKECNWCRKHSPGTACGHIWTQYKELKARRDRNRAEIATPVQEVANTVSSNSSKWIFNTGAFSHITPDRNCFESFSSVRGNVVLADKTQVEYTGVGLGRLSCRLPSGDISVVLLRRSLFVPSLWKSLYSWNSVKSIGTFALIDDGVFQIIRKLDRSVVINTFQSGNDFVLDLVPSESASLADDTDYEFWHATLGHPF
jgi:hypothetical protein